MQMSVLGKPDFKICGLRVWIHHRQFEESHDEWDGNCLTVTVHCATDGGSVRFSGTVLDAPSIAAFADGCRQQLAGVSDLAELKSLEPNISVTIRTCEGLHPFEILVEATPNAATQHHMFHFCVDREDIVSLLEDLNVVCEKFPIRGV